MKKVIIMLAVAAFAMAAQANCGNCEADKGEGGKCPSKKECPSKGGCDKGKEGSKCPAGEKKEA
jgi:hypothetical protein